MDLPNLPPPNETPEQRDIRMNKDVAAFGYVWIMSVAVFASRKDSRFAQFHSKQGMVLFLMSIPVWLIPGIGHFLTMLLVAGMLLGFIHAAQGLYIDVPIAGPLSRGELKMESVLAVVRKGLDLIVSVFKGLFKHAPKEPEKPASSEPVPTPTDVDKPPVTPVP